MADTGADDALDLLRRTADAVVSALADNTSWALSGRDHASQYDHDLVADAAALSVLGPAGVRVISEESGTSGPEDAELTVVVDPVDGSTNASLGLPHWVTALCALDADGPVAAAVWNPANGERFEARRGAGATLNGQPITVASPAAGKAVVAVTGKTPTGAPWWQSRQLGASALDLCYVACGRLHGFAATFGLSTWDYAGAALVCMEAGATVVEVGGRDPFEMSPSSGRRVVAAASPELADRIVGVL